MDKNNLEKAFPDIPESFKNKLRETLNSLPDKEEMDEMENKKIYKKGSIKKKIVLALVAAMAIGTTVFAAGGKISYVKSHGSNIPSYKTIPTAERVNKDLGVNPKLVKEFHNGYVFKSGHTLENEGVDDKGNSVAKTKSLDFIYAKGKDKLSLFIENGKLGEELRKETAIATYNGIDLYYNSYTNKFVPAGYKMTEQDKKDEEAGKYVFSFGADKVKTSQICSLRWTENEINYCLLGTDSDITKDELIKMAQQVIGTK